MVASYTTAIMSKIDRMMIQGIRSFGPEKGETIVFTTPLTLIVGWNGSGKTVCGLLWIKVI